MSATKLSRYLVTPSRVASLMDWKTTMDATAGAVMALDITRDRIGVAVASHPSTGAPARTLDPISLPSRRSNENYDSSSSSSNEIASELEEIVASERVCAFVVRWPLQDGGRMGGKCGKVLHALDSLVAPPSPGEGSSNSNSSIVNKRTSSAAVIGKNRPFALYDDRLLTGVSRGSVVGTDVPDDFGRLSSFGRVPPLLRPDMFYSSRQPHAVQVSPHDGIGEEDGEDKELSSEMAARVLQDFLDGHFSMDTAEDDDFLGLRTSGTTRASAMPKSNGGSARRNLIVSNKRQETVVAQAARDSIDEDGKQAYISQSLL